MKEILWGVTFLLLSSNLMSDVKISPKIERGVVSSDGKIVARIFAPTISPSVKSAFAQLTLFEYNAVNSQYVKTKELTLESSYAPEQVIIFSKERRIVVLDDYYYGRGNGPHAVAVYDLDTGKLLLGKSILEIFGEKVAKELPRTSDECVWRTHEPRVHGQQILLSNLMPSKEMFPWVNQVFYTTIDVVKLSVEIRVANRW